MALGVVAPPTEANGHDGAIFFKRVSQEVPFRKMTHNQNISDIAWVNGQIKDGEWMRLYEDSMTLVGLKQKVREKWDIEDDIANRLVLVLKSYQQPIKKKNPKYLVDDAAVIDPVMIDFKEYTLMARYKTGETRIQDCSCDSDFMEPAMDEVGQAIQERYSANGVRDEDVIFLVMDNAGGHGKQEVIERYESNLRDNYNIIIIWQQPRTPESNMLDLGIWMHIQFKVEEKQFSQRSEVNALWRSMQAAWDGISQTALTNVYRRWLKVLDLTEQAGGSNHLVKTQRGRLFVVPSDEAEALDDGDEEDVVDEDAADGEDAEI
jgi:hypothetical protein